MDKQQEQQITEQIANTCKFKIDGMWAKCQLCNKRFSIYYYGATSLNDRMLDHCQIHIGRI